MVNDLFLQTGLVLGVLAACFSGPALAYFFLRRRKKQMRAQRRSPIARDLLRGPGHTLREQLDAAHTELVFDVALLMVIPLTALALFLAQAHVMGMAAILHLAPLHLALALAFVAWSIRKLWRASAQLDNLRAGYDAELAVDRSWTN